MIRTLKLLLLTAIVILGGCTWADHGLHPGPTPVVGLSTGAALNSVLIVARAPWWARLGTVAAVGFTGRFIAPKWEGIHIEVVGELGWLKLGAGSFAMVRVTESARNADR